MTRGKKVFWTIAGAVLLIAMVLFAIAGIGAYEIAQYVRHRPAFALGWERARQDPALTAQLGAPLDYRFDLRQLGHDYHWAFKHDRKTKVTTDQEGTRREEIATEEYRVPVRGPRGSGSLTIAAEDRGSGWTLTRLAVEAGPGQSTEITFSSGPRTWRAHGAMSIP